MNASSSGRSLKRVVIVGGGLAGMVAANELLKQGVPVLIIEKGTRMGGKAGADLVNGVYEEHGYHVFPTWYVNTLKLIEEIGVAGNLVPITKFHYLRASDTNGQSDPESTIKQNKQRLGVYPRTKVFLQLDSFASLLHNVFNSFIPWYKSILSFYSIIDLCSHRLKERCFLDRISVNGFLHSRFYASDVIAEYHHQTVIQASAIPSYELSAMTLKNLVLNWTPKPKPLLRIMNGNLQETFILPLEKHIRSRGAEIRTETTVTQLLTDDKRISKLRLKSQEGESIEPLGSQEICIITTPPEVTTTFIDDDVFALEERNYPNREEDEVQPLGSVNLLESAPMAAFHFYLRRKIDPMPAEHVNLFNSRYVLSFIDVSQTWDGLENTTLSVIASDSKWLVNVSGQEAARAVYEELRRFIPVLKSWEEEVERVYPQMNTATPLFLNTVGAWHFRPGTRTRITNLYIAGDYCRTQADLTTMESAVMSARQTAATVLKEAGMEPSGAEPDLLRQGSFHEFLFRLAKWLLLPVVLGLWPFAGKKCSDGK